MTRPNFLKFHRTSPQVNIRTQEQTPLVVGVLGHAVAKAASAGVVVMLLMNPAAAATFTFSTGNPDGQIATLSRTASPGKIETETADDFVTTTSVSISSATFTGLLVGGATSANINDVEIELYHVFPSDSGP